MKTFSQLQAILLEIAHKVYRDKPFPRQHLLNKIYRRIPDASSWCGGTAKGTCDGQEYVRTEEGNSVCWRQFPFEDYDFMYSCSWYRAKDAFGKLVKKGYFRPSVQADQIFHLVLAVPATDSAEQYSLFEAPCRSEQIVNRIVRDSDKVLKLKNLYDYRCSLCQIRLQVSATEWLCEVHHLRPLGQPHNGPDTLCNMMVLCPNHHALFDAGVPVWNVGGSIVIGEERFQPLFKHKIAADHVNYYRKNLQHRERGRV